MSIELTEFNLSYKKIIDDFQKKFYNTPEKYVPISEIGDLHVQWFVDRYAALRMIKNMPIFEQAYSLLTERGNYSRKNAFGEMHCDGFLWIEKHPKIKVIIEERQSYKYIYIKEPCKFHIRALAYNLNYPEYRRTQLKGITIDGFRKQGFVSFCPDNVNAERFGAFTYGDARDEGYILSMDFLCKGMEKIEYADSRTISAIENMKYWQVYLDDPTELE